MEIHQRSKVTANIQLFFELDNKIAEIVKICAILGVKCGGQAAVESLHEVECAMRRLCASAGVEGHARRTTAEH